MTTVTTTCSINIIPLIVYVTISTIVAWGVYNLLDLITKNK